MMHQANLNSTSSSGNKLKEAIWNAFLTSVKHVNIKQERSIELKYLVYHRNCLSNFNVSLYLFFILINV